MAPVVEEPVFIPVMIDAAPAPEANPPSLPAEPKRQARRRPERGGGEMEIGNVTVWVGVDVGLCATTAVIAVL